MQILIIKAVTAHNHSASGKGHPSGPRKASVWQMMKKQVNRSAIARLTTKKFGGVCNLRYNKTAMMTIVFPTVPTVLISKNIAAKITLLLYEISGIIPSLNVTEDALLS